MATHVPDVLRERRRSLFPRTFRSRLTTIFVVIVLLPMLAVSVILFSLVHDVEQGRNEARLAQGQRTAQAMYTESTSRAARIAGRMASSTALANAIDGGDATAIRAQLTAGLGFEGARAVLELPDGQTIEAGAPTGVAPATVRLVGDGGATAGELTVARYSVPDYVALTKRLTALNVAIAPATDPSDSTGSLDTQGIRLPRQGTVELGERTFRVRSFSAPGFPGDPGVVVSLLSNQRSTSEAISRDTVVIGLLLLGFLVLSFAFALTVSRSLQAPVQRLLSAARRLGGGEFDVTVPEDGSDEFAELGTEFNAMARQLEARLEDLDAERGRLQGAIRRVGELSAAGLDRDAVLEIVVQTAVDGIGASAGRASARPVPGAPLSRVASVGAADHYASVLDATEAEALRDRRAAGLRHGDVHAFSQPLRSSETPEEIVGLITVARDGRPFSGGERDLFGYLASQASISIENVDLHRTVQRQAVTDELTGLFNHRRFQEVMSIEVERAKRFQQALGLIMIDIDDFKLVNDRYGHLQGDQVLREVARVLLDSSREVDEPARYGGEEMAVALPQTDLDGAVLFAERLRERIEALQVPLVAGKGTLSVTASLGAAAFPDSAVPDKDALVAAADSALYRAKRLGKNRVVRAG